VTAVRVDIVTVFPDYFAPLDLSLIGKARQDGLLDLVIHDLRQFTHDRHRTVDDTPYGGGPGMLMRPEPWGEALDHLLAQPPGPDLRPLLVVPTPAGRKLTQAMAAQWSERPWLVIACGRYEGLDQRVVDEASQRMDVVEVSLGDYVLNGGEVAALAIVESVVRLLPGVIGNPDSLTVESHSDGLLEGPAYTKPAQWRNRAVPEVLLSGDHGAVERWRRDQALIRTAQVRPDLIAALEPDTLDRQDHDVLADLGWQVVNGRFSTTPPAVAD
jgi:tRNA (guanine37-N1)-methyltransferase